jgi:putative tryptophan/tyrosine transport system substrate-binding protein
MSSRTLFGVVLLLAIAAAGPPSDAQQATRIPKIGFITSTTQVSIAHLIAAFREGLRELGYIERKTILLEVRLAEGAAERLPNSHGSWLRSSQT